MTCVGGPSTPQCRQSPGCGESSATAGVGACPRTRLSTQKAIKPPSTAAIAQISSAICQPAVNAAGSAYFSPVMPAAAGSTATASSDPVLATALFTPEATPACRSGAAASTVAVTGATAITRPRP